MPSIHCNSRPAIRVISINLVSFIPMAQGKYINDPEVLKEAAKAAGVEEYEWVIQDSSIVLDQVAACTRVATYCPCT